MKKKRNKFVVAILVICCVVGVYRLYPYIFREKGTLYSLKMSKYYKELDYSTMQVSRNKSLDIKEQDVEIYKNCKEESKKILDYLNKFELEEINSKEAFKSEDKKTEIFYIIFNRVNKEFKNNINDSNMLRISFFNNSTLELEVSHKNSKHKYYKIIKDNIDFKYVNKILNNTEKYIN